MTAVWRPMSDLERHAALSLAGIRYPVASWWKRFARSIGAQAIAERPVITDPQAGSLWRTLHRFRRQVDCPILRAIAAEEHARLAPAGPRPESPRTGALKKRRRVFQSGGRFETLALFPAAAGRDSAAPAWEEPR